MILLCLAIAPLGRAEIEQIGVPNATGTTLYWWPKLDLPEPWSFQEAAALKNGVNLYVRKGENFPGAEAVIYGRALSRPRTPEIKSLKALVANDKAQFLERHPDLTIEQMPDLLDADGRRLQVLMFIPAGKGSFEAVAYGEEPDFYLLFTLSSRTQKGFAEALPAFNSMIAKHREKPAAPAPPGK
jgi:hypothetical protein